MTSLPLVSFLMLTTQSISVPFTLLDIDDPPESPLTESEESRLISSAESMHATQSSPVSECCGISATPRCLQHPIGDCLGLSLEYFGNKTDIQNFRRTSRHFDRIHDQYRIHQDARFENFGMLFQNDSQQIEFRSIEHLLQSIPLIPDVYVGSNEPDFEGLFALHHRSGRDVLRGLAAKWEHPFISVLLWNDMNWGDDPILMVSIFAVDSMKVAVLRPNVGPNRTILAYNQPNFGVVRLNDLLSRKHIRFAHSNTPTTLWTIGKRCCSLHLRQKMCGGKLSIRKLLVTGAGTSLLVSAGSIIYLVANHQKIVLKF